MAKTKGIGGSEEAVINLSKEWVKQGYNVTVYNSCGNVPVLVDGVQYEPFWKYNSRDKFDHFILWRHPKLAEEDLNVSNIYIDLHDVIPEGEFTEKRLAKIKKIFVKTNAHRALFPHVPNDKFVIIPNGMDFALFDQKVERNPYLLVNTSSPDRSMDVLPALFKRVKEQVPQARLKWAYGFDIFDASFKNDKRMMEWRNKILAEMEEAGIENMGRLSQSDCAKLYLEGTIFAYPSEFYEIDCISVKKAQAAGCIPVTSDFAALNESNICGIKIHSRKTKSSWNKAYQISFGLEWKQAQDEWVKVVVKLLKNNAKMDEEDKKKMDRFSWDKISLLWTNILNQ